MQGLRVFEDDKEERCFLCVCMVLWQFPVKAPAPSPQQCWPQENSMLECLGGMERPLHPPDDSILHLL